MKALVRDCLDWINQLLGRRHGPEASGRPHEKPVRVHRVFEKGKPRFQLRQGEEGVSVFDARKVKPEDILPSFREGSLVTTQDTETIESFGLQVVKTPGDPRLPRLLQENHAVILAGNGMTRKQFKQALKALEDATRN